MTWGWQLYQTRRQSEQGWDPNTGHKRSLLQHSLSEVEGDAISQQVFVCLCVCVCVCVCAVCCASNVPCIQKLRVKMAFVASICSGISQNQNYNTVRKDMQHGARGGGEGEREGTSNVLPISPKTTS